DNGSFPIGLRVTDGSEATAFTTTFVVDNTPPTATLSNNGPKPERQPITFTFNGSSDPSSADTAAGFRYSFDFDNDGTSDVVDSTSAAATVKVAHEGTVPVRGRIKAADGGAQVC